MNKKLIIIFICIVILVMSGCTSSTTTPSKKPVHTSTINPSIKVTTITPRPTTNTSWDSQFAEDTVPTNLVPGKDYKFTIKAFNVGRMPWTYANNTSICPVIDDSSDTVFLNPTKSNLSKKVIVRSGQNYTWTLSIIAPTQHGNYSLKFRMINNNTTWFGDTFTKTIMVGNIGDEVTFLSKPIQYYTAVGPSSTLNIKNNVWQNVSITVNNTGRYSWSADDNTRLAAVDYEPNDAQLFNLASFFYLAPDTIVQPGEQITWKLKFHGPQYPGTYYVKYRMMKNGQWFGNTLNITVNVA